MTSLATIVKLPVKATYMRVATHSDIEVFPFIKLGSTFNAVRFIVDRATAPLMAHSQVKG